jgi:superfamily II DNA or RNA helicase/transposase-like protein
MKLRDYQLEAVEQIEGALAFGSSEISLNAPPGYGKSLVIAELFKRAIEKNESIGVIVNVSELIPQLVNTIKAHCGFEPNVIKAGMEKDSDIKAYIIMEQTVYSRGWDKEPLDYLLIDEYHLSYKTTRKNKVLNNIKPKLVVGLSGTPWDSKGYFIPNKEDMIETINTLGLVKKGFLSPIKFYKISGYDKVSQKVDNVINSKGRITDDDSFKIIQDFQLDLIHNIIGKFPQIRDSKSVWFCSSIDHAEQVAEILQRNYFGETIDQVEVNNHLFGSSVETVKVGSVGLIHSKKSDKENKEIIKKFREGKILHLVSISKVSVGFDVPDIIFGVDLKPSNSDRDFIQRIGRVRRIAENKKEGIWIDAVGNIDRLGLDIWEHIEPNDEKGQEELRRKKTIISLIDADKEIIENLEKAERKLEKIEKAKLEELELEDLLFKYDAEYHSVIEIFEIGWRIYSKLYGLQRVSTKKWIKEKLEYYDILLYENTNSSTYLKWLKYFKSSFKTLIKKSNKIASLYFTIDWLLTESYLANYLFTEERLGDLCQCPKCGQNHRENIFYPFDKDIGYDNIEMYKCPSCKEEFKQRDLIHITKSEPEYEVEYDIDMDDDFF